MKTWKQLISLVCLLVLISIVDAIGQQTYKLSVLNEAVVGSTFEFDIYMLRTGDTPIFLGDTDFKLNFNSAYFTSPTAVRVTKGLSTYSMTATLSGGIYIVNIGKPTFDDQAGFDANVTNISNTGDGTFVGRFRITGISNPSGTVGLTWRYPPTTNATVVVSLANTDPWNGSAITSSNVSSYAGSDFSLSPLTYRLSILNQVVVGSTFEFDIYMLRTGSAPIYLGDSDFKLNFNEGNFTAPTAVRVTKGLSTYSMSATISGGIYIVNIGKPTFDDQVGFDASVANISNTGNGTFVGRFRITGVSNPAGTVGLTWRYPPTSNATVVVSLANTDPWNGTNISSSSPSSYSGNDSPLPVTLSSFSARINPNVPGVHLDWSTLSEVNNYGFFVQRRAETDSLFMDLPNSFVPGHGTTLDPQSYSLVDNTVTAKGLYYYRLRQVDLDGTEHFTTGIGVSVDAVLMSVKESAPIEFKLHQNYPNPFNPMTELKFSVETNGRATVRVYSITGQEVATLFDDYAEAGRYYRVRLDGSNLATGMYFYRLESGNKSDLKKMLLVK